MVQIHVNQDHDKQFLYDSPSTCGIDSLIRNMTQIYNLQSKIQSLVLAVEERVLANRQDYQSDATLALRRALSEARAYISKDQALHKKQLSPYVLKDHVQNIEKEFIAYQSIASKDSDLLQLTSAKARNSDSMVECVLQVCFLEAHEIAAPPMVLISCMKIRPNFGGQERSSRGTSNSVITLAKMRKQSKDIHNQRR